MVLQITLVLKTYVVFGVNKPGIFGNHGIVKIAVLCWFKNSTDDLFFSKFTTLLVSKTTVLCTVVFLKYSIQTGTV